MIVTDASMNQSLDVVNTSANQSLEVLNESTSQSEDVNNEDFTTEFPSSDIHQFNEQQFSNAFNI